MKAKTFLIVLVVLTLLTSLSYARIWRLDKNDGNNPDFTTLADAVADAEVLDSDTLYIAGHTDSYGAATIEKKLYIFGPGYFLDENPETQIMPISAYIGNVTFNYGSEGSMFTGFVCNSKVTANADNVIIKRNYVFGSGSQCLGGSGNNLIIKHNYISNTYGSCCRFSLGVSGNNAIICNNYLERIGGGCAISASREAIIKNNVISGPIGISNTSFYNNIIVNGSWNATNSNNDVRNNIEYGILLEGFPSENNNQSNVDMSTVFIGYPDQGDYSTDGRWQLVEGSPAIDAGVSGEDCGMFGGNDPYVLSGIPAIPAIYFLDAATTGSATSGLPVSIKVKSRK